MDAIGPVYRQFRKDIIAITILFLFLATRVGNTGMTRTPLLVEESTIDSDKYTDIKQNHNHNDIGYF